MKRLVLATASLVATMASAVLPASTPVVEKPAAIVSDGPPPVPEELSNSTRAYLEFRTAVLQSWNPVDRSALITTRFANTPQVHEVKTPGGSRVQLSFETDRIGRARWAPAKGDVMVVEKDVGGNEFFQLYTLKDGRLTLLTDGKSRNLFGAWMRDGSLIGYSSSRRNGTDSDLYVMDPRDPKTDRRVAEVKGGGWELASFSPDRTKAVAIEYLSVAKSNLWLIDLASGSRTPIGDHKKIVGYGERAHFAPDGSLWVTSDEGSEFLRLGTVDLATGKFTARAPDPKWDVEFFDMAADGSWVAYVLNEAGVSRLKILDPKTNTARTVEGLPPGVISTLEVAPWGEIGFTFASAKGPFDTYSANPQTLAVRRWTTSETGGLDAAKNVDAELIEVQGFDGKPISGFLYRPNAAKFAGPRPLLVEIHGGPESQARPGFLGRNNYLVNELGIALFSPNVRGSSGYGKTFVSLDNGPMKREDSVKDIGSFLDRLKKDPALDSNRFAVTGGSYGGYMCYASAIRYGSQFKAANCYIAISNFVTFLQNTQSYRRDLRRAEYGDERDPKQRAKLTEISPLTSVSKLTIPLLVVTGANDPRVPASEAEQMVRAVRGRGGLAWHLLAQDEGHGFAKKANQDYHFWTSLMFYQQTLLK